MFDFFKKPYYTRDQWDFGHRRTLTRNRTAAAAAVILSVLLFSGCAAFTPAGANRPLSTLVHVYRGPLDHLNSVRDGTCPMHPSCSTYALEATDKNGPLVGWMMAFDRLIRCGRDEVNYAPKIPVDGNWRYHDPVSANDFWWQDLEEEPPSGKNYKEVKWAAKQKSTNP